MFDLKKLIDRKKLEAKAEIAITKTEDTAVFNEYLSKREAALCALVSKSEYLPELNHWKLKGPFRSAYEIELRLIPRTTFGVKKGSTEVHERIVEDFNAELKKNTPGLHIILYYTYSGSTF